MVENKKQKRHYLVSEMILSIIRFTVSCVLLCTMFYNFTGKKYNTRKQNQKTKTVSLFLISLLQSRQHYRGGRDSESM